MHGNGGKIRMKQKRILRMKKVVCAVVVMALVGASISTQPTLAAKKAEKRGCYSNLVDKKSQKETKKALMNAGISEKTVDAWLAQVRSYNKTIQNSGLVKKGFVKLGKKNPVYPEGKISELWNKKNKLFLGYNCRLTAFTLLKDFIKVEDTSNPNPTVLFMDQDAYNHAPTAPFSKKKYKTFENLFSSVNTIYSSNTKKQINYLTKAWKKKGIKVSSKTKASLITVVMHSSFSKEENELYVGHTGVLVPLKNGKLMFIEKLSFELPYQVTKFDNRKQLNNYLMGMYDTEWGQGTAHPFLMENTKLMKGYHVLSTKKDVK